MLNLTANLDAYMDCCEIDLTLLLYIATSVIKENTIKSNPRLNLSAFPDISSKRKLSIQKHPDVLWTPLTYLTLGAPTKSAVRWVHQGDLDFVIFIVPRVHAVWHKIFKLITIKHILL